MQSDIHELAKDISNWIGPALTAVTTRAELVGTWQSVLFHWPQKPDGYFLFSADGKLERQFVRGSKWYNRFYDVVEPGIVSFFLREDDSNLNWQFRASDAVYFVWRSSDGRIVLSNGDTSILRLLEIVPEE
jgi:hypothetical protein